MREVGVVHPLRKCLNRLADVYIPEEYRFQVVEYSLEKGERTGEKQNCHTFEEARHVADAEKSEGMANLVYQRNEHSLETLVYFVVVEGGVVKSSDDFSKLDSVSLSVPFLVRKPKEFRTTMLVTGYKTYSQLAHSAIRLCHTLWVAIHPNNDVKLSNNKTRLDYFLFQPLRRITKAPEKDLSEVVRRDPPIQLHLSAEDVDLVDLLRIKAFTWILSREELIFLALNCYIHVVSRCSSGYQLEVVTPKGDHVSLPIPGLYALNAISDQKKED